VKVISLFSGAGGLDLGLIQAGHTVIWANDNDRDSCETYMANIGNHVVCKDISSVRLSEIPRGDVVVGGFPCQGFSMANLLRTVSDERNKLYRHFLRIVRDKQPRYFLAENVRGILSLDGGRVIGRIVSDFAKGGYRVAYKCFNAADYGVSQTRFRVVIAGTRKDLPAEQEFVFPKPTHAKPSSGTGLVTEGLRPWVTISEALRGIPEPGYGAGLPNHICSRYKVTNRNFTGHRKTDPGKPSPTILARGNGKGGVCAIQHPQNHRRLSVRESAIIQTFPLEFEFAGAMNSCYRQVGNAVPVLFARHLGLALRAIEENCVKCA
jgi:DNA (cytosine-5)-methyltransferase 1